ncbi:hypothetical protein N9288_01960, partial [bacterium]|nr:hypothetical protein [bacterium]
AVLKEKDVEFQLAVIEPQRGHNESLQRSSEAPQVTNLGKPLVPPEKGDGQKNRNNITKIKGE